MTEQVLHLSDSCPERDFRLIVRYEKRGVGLLPVKGLPIPPAPGSVEHTVGPGQALEYTCRVHQMYDLSALGTYHVTASRRVARPRGDGDAEVLANTVHLVVSEDEPPPSGTITRSRAETNAAARTKSTMDRRGLIAEGFRLTAAFQNSTVAPGQPVGLSFALENRTAQALRFWESYPELDYNLIVLNARGDQLPATRDGSAVVSMVWRDAQPGEVLAYTYALDEMYDISAVGKYRITASRRVPRLDGNGWTEVVSNTVVLKVVE